MVAALTLKPTLVATRLLYISPAPLSWLRNHGCGCCWESGATMKAEPGRTPLPVSGTLTLGTPSWRIRGAVPPFNTPQNAALLYGVNAPPKHFNTSQDRVGEATWDSAHQGMCGNGRGWLCVFYPQVPEDTNHPASHVGH